MNQSQEIENLKQALANAIQRIECLEKPNLKLLNYHTVQDIENVEDMIEQITRYLMETSDFEPEARQVQTWTHDPHYEQNLEDNIKDGLEGLKV